jgi:hypothetical protein
MSEQKDTINDLSREDLFELLWCTYESIVKEKEKQAILGDMTQEEVDEWCKEMEIDTVDIGKTKKRIARLEQLANKLKDICKGE